MTALEAKKAAVLSKALNAIDMAVAKATPGGSRTVLVAYAKDEGPELLEAQIVPMGYTLKGEMSASFAVFQISF